MLRAASQRPIIPRHSITPHHHCPVEYVVTAIKRLSGNPKYQAVQRQSCALLAHSTLEHHGCHYEARRFITESGGGDDNVTLQIGDQTWANLNTECFNFAIATTPGGIVSASVISDGEGAAQMGILYELTGSTPGGAMRTWFTDVH